jgi:hypothetical protein
MAHETGHAKTLESWTKLVAFDATLDAARLNAPPDLVSSALKAKETSATQLQDKVGNSRADWRTVALARAVLVDKFDSLATRSVAQLEARGASKETIEDARGYVRKIQGRSNTPKPKDNPDTPNIDESEKGVSTSQQSNAAKLSLFYELIDFLEAQSAYASVMQAGLTIADLRAAADAARDKHEESIVAATTLSNDRIARNKGYYTDADSIHTLAARYKALVKGAYGANSPEFKTVNAIPFKKPKL